MKRYIFKKKQERAAVYKKIIDLSKGYLVIDFNKHKTSFERR